MTIRQLTTYILALLLVTTCKRTNKINPDNVESVALIKTTHPYIGDRVDSIKLDDKLILEFLTDFADKKEEVTKFYSCYVIKIRLKDGQLISYRTNGQVFEKFKDDNTTATYFKLNQDINIVSKYWKIPKEQFCATKQITTADIKGNWYLNKWTMYHTLKFDEKTLFIDNHIDSVLYSNYFLDNDTLILQDSDSTIRYKNKIIAITRDTLIIRSFGNGADILGYSRTKREWKNE
ncbi:hypothetical protein H1R16_02220 [Marnyiella aurantia]|uniref:Uncharacterized protein n=1 Tax=Marnyiella aurantia TaxID=2758037 RepID=A0A7D7QWI3_9FLAO|nr:hypothetical protein [Marnyiella aurantia]MBA5245746.1 hypothetical protein [Marnyiella aurantia]QMS98850.1 hypothetical protein H1R16_02220 [Marnyiella aurantia]